MKSDLENKLIKDLDGMNAEEWISFMAYFGPKMLDEQSILAEVICRRAEKNAAEFNERSERQGGSSRHVPGDEIASLITSIGMKLALC